MPESTWTVWGDAKEPILSHVDMDTMKTCVDGDGTGTLWGEDPATGVRYTGIETYVVQQRRSASNPTDKIRVVRYRDWISYMNTGRPDPIPALSEHDNYGAAGAACDAANNPRGE